MNGGFQVFLALSPPTFTYYSNPPGVVHLPVCPVCRLRVQPGWRFCAECGCNLACGSCGSDVRPIDNYCTNCGIRLFKTRVSLSYPKRRCSYPATVVRSIFVP